jgi:hypothetical protein
MERHTIIIAIGLNPIPTLIPNTALDTHYHPRVPEHHNAIAIRTSTC